MTELERQRWRCGRQPSPLVLHFVSVERHTRTLHLKIKKAHFSSKDRVKNLARSFFLGKLIPVFLLLFVYLALREWLGNCVVKSMLAKI